MDVHIAPNIVADVTKMTDKQGMPHAIVVIKQSFSIPLTENDSPQLLDNKWPLFYEDTFAGETGLSATIFENDFVLNKQYCDIVLNAKAYRPQSVQSYNEKDSFIVGFRVANCLKKAEVLPSPHEQKHKSPKPVWLHYGSTWGGIWQRKEDDIFVFSANPVGKGYIPKKHHDMINRIDLPEVLYPYVRTQSLEPEEVKPCAFSTLARSATPRLHYAGTYDDTWYNEVFPLLPTDFDERFFQCVPEDQQISYPQGGEKVEFLSLHPEQPHISFHLPKLDIPVTFKDKNANLHKLTPVIDTVQFDLEKQEFAMVWRCQHPLQRSLRELEVAIVGEVDKTTYDQLLGCGNGGCADSSGEPCCGGCADGEDCESDDTHDHPVDDQQHDPHSDYPAKHRQDAAKKSPKTSTNTTLIDNEHIVGNYYPDT